MLPMRARQTAEIVKVSFKAIAAEILPPLSTSIRVNVC
jgi:hypothetical protein